jgi:hypothetical protein
MDSVAYRAAAAREARRASKVAGRKLFCPKCLIKSWLGSSRDYWKAAAECAHNEMDK